MRFDFTSLAFGVRTAKFMPSAWVANAQLKRPGSNSRLRLQMYGALLVLQGENHIVRWDAERIRKFAGCFSCV